MRFVKASKSDIDNITEIELNCGYHKNPIRSDIRKLFVNFFKSSKSFAYIMKNKSKDIGYFAFRIVNNNCELDYIAIDKDYQGKGFGKLLLNKIISLSEKMKLKSIKLFVRLSNKKAISLYTQYGFIFLTKQNNKIFMTKEIQNGRK
jgi:ribosomal protein S18 acetylase RimI-like enzyme